MNSLLNYLNVHQTDVWQVIGIDSIYNKAIVLAPKGHSSSQDVTKLINLAHCCVYVLVPPDSMVDDMPLYQVQAKHAPHFGLLVLLHKRLFDEPYQYGIIQKIS